MIDMSVRLPELFACAATAALLSSAAACAAHQPSAMDHEPRLAASYGPPGMARAGAMPPAALVETIPVAPDDDMVWVDGYWHWAGMDWMWVDGRWTYAPDGYVYVEPYYEWYGGYCDYVPGYWDDPGEIPPESVVVRDHRGDDGRPATVRVPADRGGSGHHPSADVVRDHRGGDRDNTRVPADYDSDVYRPHADVVRDHRRQPEPVVVTEPGAASAPTTVVEPAAVGQPSAPTHVIVVYPDAPGGATNPISPTTTTTYPVGGVVVTQPVRTRSTYNPPVKRTTRTRTVTPPPRTKTTTRTRRTTKAPARKAAPAKAPVRRKAAPVRKR